MFPAQEAASQVKENKKDTLLAMPNVVAVGVCYKSIKGVTSQEISVVVLVRRKLPLAALGPEMVIPAQIEGVRRSTSEKWAKFAPYSPAPIVGVLPLVGSASAITKLQPGRLAAWCGIAPAMRA